MPGPYLVTTKPKCPTCRAGELGDDGGGECLCADAVSRRGAVTLKDDGEPGALSVARDEVKKTHAATGQSWDHSWDGWAATYLYVTDEGGTVGPLPNGTTIEVKPVEWWEIAEVAAEPRRHDDVPRLKRMAALGKRPTAEEQSDLIAAANAYFEAEEGGAQ